MEFVIDPSMTEESLNTLIRGKEIANTMLRKDIAINDRLIAQAKLRLINKDLENAEVE
ncbi:MULTISPECIES: hypothetical protein [unclassified Caballeronia]|uniref:hypothetical protein n=1 Tax=unclassified Caballeronia TaxID=2646786 RepID=UPI001F157882|nr:MULTISPECIES: hypothetical protein [unclassified Caballeronia]MCE4541391.1 hypothetical protein [Caballeronia sp. PC1]MCE4569565.1 hypothetical protein [Caballeronia sp. CLC5]